MVVSTADDLIWSPAAPASGTIEGVRFRYDVTAPEKG